MDIYAFGSLCRGEIDLESDVDLLVVTNHEHHEINMDTYSVYSQDRIMQLWRAGNPFAWHLTLESKCIYSSLKDDFISTLGHPAPYVNVYEDCIKFNEVVCSAHSSLIKSRVTEIFDLSSVFLGLRNFATCYSLGYLQKPLFSRSAALLLGDDNLAITKQDYLTLLRCRMLCTRGRGIVPTYNEIQSATASISIILSWMTSLTKKITDSPHE